MNFNKIQFHSGMSIPEFLGSFGTEAQCAETIKAARWPGGFRRPRCDLADHYFVGHGSRKLFQCNGCQRQTSLTAGSLMEHTKLPLSTWFLAIYLISQAKTGLPALALKRQLGVSYPAAWLVLQKLNRAMARQNSTHQLSGVVQLDDAYFGGGRAGGKAGRGAENKVPSVAAVSVDYQGHPRYLKLNLVSGFTLEAISKWAKANLAPKNTVLSDCLGCFTATADAGCVHVPVVVGSLKPRDVPQFKWINTVLANLKTTLAGAFHALKYSKYAEHAAFSYRFNRRFDLRGLGARLIVDVTRCKPIKEPLVRAYAEARF